MEVPDSSRPLAETHVSHHRRAPLVTTLDPPREGVPAGEQITLRALFWIYRSRLLPTYGLFLAESLLLLAKPMTLGWAINDTLRHRPAGLWCVIGIHLVHLGIGIGGRMYDTRTFTSIYGELVGRLVLDQHRRGVDVSRVVAHSALSRQFVDFFERYVPLILHGAFATTGALAFLAYYDAWLVPLCLGLVLPAWLINRWYGRQTLP